MHGLMNRAVQCFLRDAYGEEVWMGVAQAAGVEPEGFEALLTYPDEVTEAVLAAASARLGKPRDALLEDVGIYLVGLEPLRRLLRFGGVSYTDFLDTLEELPGRAMLAVPDLGLPTLDVRAHGHGRLTLLCRPGFPGMGHVFAGVLRALADDYGALALIDHAGEDDDGETVEIELLEASFSEGRRFDLARPRVAGPL
ncbi:heme NO-binding domain-containing protein [Ostreiculturibacter nitratireducens]|uniref:heme NO-binding domain-containing protein n=1 Tax=Ostreiculturibacter nitratireducens TaxID=3075226 RepID=UPI0031B5C108